MGLSCMETGDLLSALEQFVESNSNVVDVQWDRRMSPRLLVNPYAENNEEKKIAAHYFLLAASILEEEVVGFSENARRLLVYLHEKMGSRLFEIRKPHLFEEEIIKCGFQHTLGPYREVIPEVLVRVNNFVKTTAERNLVEYAQKFSKPADLVEDLKENIELPNVPHKDEMWSYLRWMVRSKPDLRLFDHFSPEDLCVPLTRENADVAVSLGLIKFSAPYLWRDKSSAEKAREKLTNFAKQLFPKDPAKVDYPFFLLGRWLRQKSLNRNTLKDALQFFDQMHKVTGQPHAYYHKMSRYKSGWEKKTANILSKMNISYGYETITFPLPGDTYTPDFILDLEVQGRRIILEPHYEMSRKQARKYALFKRTYGHAFMLILLLKNDLIPFYHERKVLADDVCDDVWPIEYVDLLVERIRTGTYGQ